MRKIPIFDAANDGVHSPAADPSFEDSCLIFWRDAAAGLAGFCRVGQQPQECRFSACFSVFADDGLRFRRSVAAAPLLASDRGERHMSWGSQLHLDLEALTIAADFADCEGLLRFEDFHPRFNYFELVRMPGVRPAGSGHFEVAGRVTGRLRFAGREFAVDALGFRDRAWGPRAWDKLQAGRWWPSVFGPDLAVSTMAVTFETGAAGAFGYAIMDGQAFALEDVEVFAPMGGEALSCGPMVRFRLENGEAGAISHTAADAVAVRLGSFVAVEAIGTGRWGDRVGVSNIEMFERQAGRFKPRALLGANRVDGLSRR